MTNIRSKIGEFCPECHRLVKVWMHVCFGPDAHNEYHCNWCSWTGRRPKVGILCENQWPEYEPRWPFDPPHPITCACTGHAYFDGG